MNQQRWIITIHDDSDSSVNQQIHALKELLLDASPGITLLQAQSNDLTQGWGDTIIALVQTSAAVAAVNSLSLWFKSRHCSSLELEIKDFKFKAQNITHKNYEETLDKLLRYVQEHKE